MLNGHIAHLYRGHAEHGQLEIARGLGLHGHPDPHGHADADRDLELHNRTVSDQAARPGDTALREALTRARVTHAHVAGAAPQDPEAELSRAFPRAATAVHSARVFVVDALQRWGRPELVEDARMLASELATNAITHARSDFTVGITRTPRGGVRLAVGDRVATPPQLRPCGVLAPHGRGLRVVDALSSQWGFETVPEGKLVWACLGEQRGARR